MWMRTGHFYHTINFTPVTSNADGSQALLMAATVMAPGEEQTKFNTMDTRMSPSTAYLIPLHLPAVSYCEQCSRRSAATCSTLQSMNTMYQTQLGPGLCAIKSWRLSIANTNTNEKMCCNGVYIFRILYASSVFEFVYCTNKSAAAKQRNTVLWSNFSLHFVKYYMCV
jgi:hypothetical protein